MGVVQKEALLTTIVSYVGLIVGYVNKGFLFLVFLTSEQIGLLNLLLSVGLLFGQLSNLGLINTVWRFFPFFRNEAKGNYNFLPTVLKIVFISSLVFILLSYLLRGQIVFLYQEKSTLFVHFYYWIIPIGIANVFYLIADMFLRGMYKNTLSVVVNEFVHRVAITIILVLFAYKWIDFNLLVILFALSYFIPTLILFIYLLKKRELKFKASTYKIPKRFRRILVHYSLFSYFNSIGAMVVITMDAMMIASFLGLKETGIYTTILYLISAMQIPNRSIFRVGTGLVAKYWKEKDMDKMNELYRKTSSISLIISLYTFLLVWLNIEAVFGFLPKDFQVGISTFLIFMTGKLVDIYFGLNGIIFITSKKYRYDILFTAILLLMVYFLNLYLIPAYGIAGAAFSTSFAIVFYNIGRLYFVWRWYKLQPFETNQLFVITLFFVLVLGFQYLPTLKFSVILDILYKSSLISITFFGTILFFKWNDDLSGYVQKILRRLKA